MQTDVHACRKTKEMHSWSERLCCKNMRKEGPPSNAISSCFTKGPSCEPFAQLPIIR